MSGAFLLEFLVDTVVDGLRFCWTYTLLPFLAGSGPLAWALILPWIGDQSRYALAQVGITDFSSMLWLAGLAGIFANGLYRGCCRD